MAETVQSVLFITLTIAFFGSAEKLVDSVPAAITVYRNPEFFRNLTGRKEDLDNEEEEEDKGDAYANNSEEFYDFDDEYKYPGEPKKPNPPAPPEFFTYFDESPEFQPSPRDISPPRGRNIGEEHSEEVDYENQLLGELRSTTPSLYHYGNQEDGDREMSDEDSADREATDHRDGREYENQDDERDGSDEEKEANEEDISETVEHIEDDEPKKKSKYMKNLQTRAPAKVYEESKEYFNPILSEGVTGFNYPSTFEDHDYYSYEEDDRKRPYVDNKKGTREYLKDHSIEEIEEPRGPGNVRAGTKHIFRTVSKIGIKTFQPVLYYPHHVTRIKKKYKILHKPKKFHGWHHYREIPDDSVYQLRSDYDSDFEFF